MFSRLLSWIGWESDDLPTAEMRRPTPARSATSHLLTKRPPTAAQKTPKAAVSQADFNPYNTGKFDRSASWERISKSQR
jgi:hypothetical protein